MIEIKDKENNVYYKNNPEYFEELLNIYNTNIKGAAGIIRYSKKYLADWIYEITKDKLSKNNNATRIFWIFHNITDYPKCANEKCQNKITGNVYRVSCGYNSYGKYDGMTKCCSISCLNKCDEHNEKIWTTYYTHKNSNENFVNDIILKRKATKKKLYNDENYCNVEKCKQTKFERYNDPNYCNMEKNKQTRYEHNGDGIYHSKESLHKMNQTTLKHFGVKWSLSSQKVREKGKETKLRKYGDKNYSNREQFLKTLTKRFGKARCPQYVYFYNGKYFDSGTELCFYIYCIDHNIDIKQSELRIKYISDDGKVSYYFPDFEINGEIIEIKGDHFLNEKNELINPYDNNKLNLAKTKCMKDNNVRIIRFSELKEVYDYVESKYGKDFIKNQKLKKV